MKALGSCGVNLCKGENMFPCREYLLILKNTHFGFNSPSCTLDYHPSRSSLLTPHSSLLTPHSSLLTPHSSLLTPHSSLLTPHSSLLTPHSSLLTPHSSLLTPHSSLLTPHSSLLTPHLLPCLNQIHNALVGIPAEPHAIILLSYPPKYIN